ncbi:MAG: dihydroorotase [Chitinophagales bacterium]
MKNYLIKNANLVNEGKIFTSDLLIKNGRIEKIASDISVDFQVETIDAKGKYLTPGIIDDQVHFREPGLTHKANIYTEARAAVAGGVTSFMEMPNTKPTATTQEELEKKYQTASKTSLANYSFFMGGANDNYEEVMKTDRTKVCGLKLFMGSSTGNMLVDDERALRQYFGNYEGLIATHCEDEFTVRNNEKLAKEKFGENVPFDQHPIIRDVEACYLSSSKAAALAESLGTRLHILHISTAKELELFRNDIPLKEKKITAEACVHHLWFDASQYETMGSLIKCNPAIKEASNKAAIFQALLDNKIDVIATDHAPHTWEEKQNTYFSAPSGLPLVQHSLQMMLDFYHQGKISFERIIEKMCHANADLFDIQERGYLREGYFADLVLVDLNKNYTVTKENIAFKCGWSPLENYTFKDSISKTFVNGNLVFNEGIWNESTRGSRLTFDLRN